MTKEDLTNEVKVKAPLVQGMTELVIKINGGLDGPIIHPAVIMPILTEQSKYLSYLIINTNNFGTFIPTNTLVEIKDKLTKGTNDPALVNLLKEHGYRIINFDKSMTAFSFNSVTGISAIAAHLSSVLPSLGKSVHHCNLASRMKIYLTGTPAGLGRFTRIPMVLNNEVPHKKVKTTHYLLSDFIPVLKKVIVTTSEDPTNYKVVDASEVSFEDDLDMRNSTVTELYVDKMGAIEQLQTLVQKESKAKLYAENRVNELLAELTKLNEPKVEKKNKHPKEDAAPQKETPIKIVDLKDLPPGAAIKIDKNPPPVTTSKVNKKKSSKSKPKASK